jgi:outer membrane protein
MAKQYKQSGVLTMKKLAILLVLITNISFADTVFGVYTGVQTWLHDNSGDFSLDNQSYNARENINQNSENNLSFYVAVEHALPFIPNIKLRQSNLEINRFFQVDNVACPAVVPSPCLPSTSLDLSHLDATLYYEILDNWVNLDLGLSLIYFNGNIDFASGLDPQLSNIDYDKVVPALYGKALFELPVTDLSASITANVGTLTSNTIVDFEMAAQYKIGLGFNIEAGYRQQTIDFEDIAGSQTDSQSKGVFAALNFHF